MPELDDVPACWSWEIPPARTREEEIERVLAEQVGRPHGHAFDRADIELMLAGDPSTGRWGLFHDDRCAVCGVHGRDLVIDHCHSTGQVRGRLCRGCNTREGKSNAPLFIRYRRIHPAAIIGLYEPYTGRDWLNGYYLGDYSNYDTEGPRPATPWTPWLKEDALDGAPGSSATS